MIEDWSLPKEIAFPVLGLKDDRWSLGSDMKGLPRDYTNARLEGQINGSGVMGIGYALGERMRKCSGPYKRSSKITHKFIRRKT